MPPNVCFGKLGIQDYTCGLSVTSINHVESLVGHFIPSPLYGTLCINLDIFKPLPFVMSTWFMNGPNDKLCMYISSNSKDLSKKKVINVIIEGKIVV